MKLIVSILALATLTSTAYAKDCTPEVQKLISEVWQLPTRASRIEAGVQMYGETPPAQLVNANKGYKVELSKQQFSKLPKSFKSSIPSQTDALWGVRIEVRKKDGVTELVKTGYLHSQNWDNMDKHFFTRSDDFKVVLNSDCKMNGFSYSRPDQVVVTANDCIWIRSQPIKDLESNMVGFRKTVQKYFADRRPNSTKIGEKTADLIGINCRDKFGTHQSEFVKLLPPASKASSNCPTCIMSEAGSSTKVRSARP
jgi:hypothetical protein